MTLKFILASASPRRKALLKQIGINADVFAVDIDESPKIGEQPIDMVLRLAQQKAKEAQKQLDAQCDKQNLTILAADTIIEHDGAALGKPKDEDDAVAMLTSLSNKAHRVITAFCVLQGQREHLQSVISTIQFAKIEEVEARQYWQSGEPHDKAGSYAIQGYGAAFVKHLEGSYSAVVGLPLYECKCVLQEFGVLA